MDAKEVQGAAFRLALGRRLEAARIHRGLSLNDVAAEIGKVRQTIHAWEKGRNPINSDDLWALAQLYQTSVVALVAEKITADDVLALTKQTIEEARLGEPKNPTTPARKRHPRAA